MATTVKTRKRQTVEKQFVAAACYRLLNCGVDSLNPDKCSDELEASRIVVVSCLQATARKMTTGELDVLKCAFDGVDEAGRSIAVDI